MDISFLIFEQLVVKKEVGGSRKEVEGWISKKYGVDISFLVFEQLVVKQEHLVVKKVGKEEGRR